MDVVEGEDAGRFGGKLLGQETRVVRDDHAAPFLLRFNQIVGDSLAGDADVLECEIFPNDAPPP